MSQKNDFVSQFQVGSLVHIKPGMRSPYSGETGKVSDIDLSSGIPLYLVHFEDGLAFSYHRNELDLAGDSAPEGKAAAKRPAKSKFLDNALRTLSKLSKLAEIWSATRSRGL